MLRFRVFIHTAQKLDSVVWTGTRFLYVQNTANTIFAAPPQGQPLRRFAGLPRRVEETRCVRSPGAHGFPAGAIFCHTPDNRIDEISANGARQRVFAVLPAPYPPAADGAVAFDTTGRFGYRIVAATGRSGGRRPAGGQVFTIDARGRVRRVGRYPGPGGADELIQAPRRFGSAGGDALLTVDAGAAGGRVVAVDPRGHARTIVTLPSGLSPIASVPGSVERAAVSRGPHPGFYVTDDRTGNTDFAPAGSFAQYAGDLIVGTESPRAEFWAVEPRGSGYAAVRLSADLSGRTSLEQAIFVG